MSFSIDSDPILSDAVIDNSTFERLSAIPKDKIMSAPVSKTIAVDKQHDRFQLFRPMNITENRDLGKRLVARSSSILLLGDVAIDRTRNTESVPIFCFTATASLLNRTNWRKYHGVFTRCNLQMYYECIHG